MENLTPDYIKQILLNQSKVIDTLVERLTRLEKKFPDIEDGKPKIEQASAEEIEDLMRQFGI